MGHVEIRKPPNSGSFYFNYKKTFCIVLMAIVNAKSEFLMVDVGKNGRNSDAGVFGHTTFSKMLESGSLHLPDAEELVTVEEKLAYVFVADDAFPLKEHIMKPYSGTQLSPQELNFNKCLSSSRVRVENAFGILAHRFQVLVKPINLRPEKVTKIVLACCFLHNFLKRKNGTVYEALSSNEDVLIGLELTTSRNATTIAKNIRNKLCAYINSNISNI
ncbi:uncharacterized protein LOC129945139 [Eupeodes corollae]|uniref:uncharacterized protein LOC129945139 n=1 Tax=Eupeodes corollae TaxID=290404 RepID=UPI002492BDC5|nr:uncharacterized protein LOC129945139 [Eupeodes corollae]